VLESFLLAIAVVSITVRRTVSGTVSVGTVAITVTGISKTVSTISVVTVVSIGISLGLGISGPLAVVVTVNSSIRVSGITVVTGISRVRGSGITVTGIS